jgi:hypothetical protein
MVKRRGKRQLRLQLPGYGAKHVGWDQLAQRAPAHQRSEQPAAKPPPGGSTEREELAPDQRAVWQVAGGPALRLSHPTSQAHAWRKACRVGPARAASAGPPAVYPKTAFG